MIKSPQELENQPRVITQNFGLAKGTLDATKHVSLLTPGPDGYTNMDAYNKAAPWSRRS